MWAVFGIGHLAVPEQIPFDYTVLLAGFIGGMVAVLNFFLMGLTVQKIVSMEDDKQAAAKMKASYSQRMMLQLIWGVLAIAVPCFQFVAGILPLLFPNIVIKTCWIIGGGRPHNDIYNFYVTIQQVLLREVCDRCGTEQLQIYNDRR